MLRRISEIVLENLFSNIEFAMRTFHLRKCLLILV